MAKKIILSIVAVAFSFYFSILFLIGMVFGYWGVNKFCKKYIECGKISPVYLNFGNWELHFHHWLSGALALLIFWLLGLYQVTPEIILGAMGGMVVHDIHTDKEWHKVFYRK